MGPEFLRALAWTALTMLASAAYSAVVFYLGFRVGRWTSVAERLLPARPEPDAAAKLRQLRRLQAMRFQQGLYPGQTYTPVTRQMQREAMEHGRAGDDGSAES